MPNSVDFGGRPFHFIGVGGIGMSALAYILTSRNLPVSGSDLRLTHITRRLQESGVHIFWKQEAANLNFFQVPASQRPWKAFSTDGSESARAISNVKSAQLPQVVCSTAIDARNPEFRAAVEMGCPIFHRSDILAALINRYESIAVAGTHGKTTTSSMIAYLLLQAGLDPTIVVGGEVSAWDGNARMGQSNYLVAEADESDGTLAKLSSAIGVVTNIELDHTDHYKTLDEVVTIFKTFAAKCTTLIGCIDCETVYSELQPTISYSLDPESGATFVASDIHYGATGTSATISERGTELGTLTLGVLGEHNLSNAIAAIAVGRYLGIPFAKIAAIMESFEGARRRFEQRGNYGDIQFVDDYAHHPSEIRATLAAARLKLQQTKGKTDSAARKRVVAVFQPHRYSRTAALLGDFADAFIDADQVVISDIYAAGEANVYDISGEQVAKAIAKRHPHTLYRQTLEEIQETLTTMLRPGDLVLFMGAGNLNQVIPDVMARFIDVESPSLPKVS